MLLKQINFIRGSVRIKIHGNYIERFINICAANNIAFWDVTRINENTICATVKISGFRAIRYYAKKAMCRVHILKKSGLPFIVKKFSKRYALIASFLASIIFIWMLCGCIWTVEITGCEKLKQAEVMQILQKHGFHIGMKASEIDCDLLRTNVLKDNDDILWFTINVKGSHSEIIISERSEKPEKTDLEIPCNLVAKKDGVITDLHVKDGISKVEAGTTVMKGELLVSGIQESQLTGTRMIHSMGEIMARTWYNLSAVLPEPDGEKSYTGNQKVRYSLIIGNKRINLFINSGNPYTKCDRITDKRSVFTGDDIKLPLCIVSENILEYETFENTAYEERAEDILTSVLEKRLASTIGDGEVVSSEFSLIKKEGYYVGVLSAECIENIAEQIPIVSDGQPPA